MAATVLQVNSYISSIRSGIADFTYKVTRKEKLGHTDVFCPRQKVVLLSAYLDIVVDYFNPFLVSNGVTPYSSNNFFTTDEIRDVMQHINNIASTYYILNL